jgi:hypothetical protein
MGRDTGVFREKKPPAKKKGKRSGKSAVAVGKLDVVRELNETLDQVDHSSLLPHAEHMTLQLEERLADYVRDFDRTQLPMPISLFFDKMRDAEHQHLDARESTWGSLLPFLKAMEKGGALTLRHDKRSNQHSIIALDAQRRSAGSNLTAGALEKLVESCPTPPDQWDAASSSSEDHVEDDMSSAVGSSFTDLGSSLSGSIATTAMTAIPINHAKDRMKERAVGMREVKTSLKHGAGVRSGGMRTFQSGGLTVITEADGKTVVTTFRSALPEKVNDSWPAEPGGTTLDQGPYFQRRRGTEGGRFEGFVQKIVPSICLGKSYTMEEIEEKIAAVFSAPISKECKHAMRAVWVIGTGPGTEDAKLVNLLLDTIDALIKPEPDEAKEKSMQHEPAAAIAAILGTRVPQFWSQVKDEKLRCRIKAVAKHTPLLWENVSAKLVSTVLAQGEEMAEGATEDNSVLIARTTKAVMALHMQGHKVNDIFRPGRAGVVSVSAHRTKGGQGGRLRFHRKVIVAGNGLAQMAIAREAAAPEHLALRDSDAVDRSPNTCRDRDRDTDGRLEQLRSHLSHSLGCRVSIEHMDRPRFLRDRPELEECAEDGSPMLCLKTADSGDVLERLLDLLAYMVPYEYRQLTNPSYVEVGPDLPKQKTPAESLLRHKLLDDGVQGEGDDEDEDEYMHNPYELMQQDDYRQKVSKLYQQYCPDKLAEVDTLLAKYKGKEKALMRAIVKKYSALKPIALDDQTDGHVQPADQPCQQLRMDRVAALKLIEDAKTAEGAGDVTKALELFGRALTGLESLGESRPKLLARIGRLRQELCLVVAPILDCNAGDYSHGRSGSHSPVFSPVKLARNGESVGIDGKELDDLSLKASGVAAAQGPAYVGGAAQEDFSAFF